MHRMACARCLAALRAGSSIAANTAMIAITTSNSIKVNPLAAFIADPDLILWFIFILNMLVLLIRRLEVSFQPPVQFIFL